MAEDAEEDEDEGDCEELELPLALGSLELPAEGCLATAEPTRSEVVMQQATVRSNILRFILLPFFRFVVVPHDQATQQIARRIETVFQPTSEAKGGNGVKN